MKITSKQNYKSNPIHWETPIGVSETVPDDSYTIGELLKKHESGLALGIKRLGNFANIEDDEFDQIDMEKFQNMEMTEQMQVTEAMQETLAEGKKSAAITAKRKAEELAKEKEAKKARIEAKKAEFAKNLLKEK
ncbi:MAG: hypothetical protein [Microviridae sp.]|nr:MAG: hypothetical protein [Microviridae sp.]